MKYYENIFGFPVIVSHHLTKTHMVEKRRTWRQRLFGRPWRPRLKKEIIIETVPDPHIYLIELPQYQQFGDTELNIPPNWWAGEPIQIKQTIVQTNRKKYLAAHPSIIEAIVANVPLGSDHRNDNNEMNNIHSFDFRPTMRHTTDRPAVPRRAGPPNDLMDGLRWSLFSDAELANMPTAKIHTQTMKISPFECNTLWDPDPADIPGAVDIKYNVGISPLFWDRLKDHATATGQRLGADPTGLTIEKLENALKDLENRKIVD